MELINCYIYLGYFLVGLFSLSKPNLDKGIYIPIYILLVIIVLLVSYHKLFRLIRKREKGAVYKVSWGIKHWIENPITLRRLGHTWDDVDNISGFEFNLYPMGKSINLAKKGEYK